MRARSGLLRDREFTMKDAYSFDVDETAFKKSYEQMAEVYKKIFDSLGLETKQVLADNGYIGGEYCHEFVVESEVGESKFLVTEDGSYAAHEDVAKFIPDTLVETDKEMKPMEDVEGKGIIGVEELAKFRAARRIWARMMKEEFGVTNPRAWMLPMHVQTAGVSLTAQQPYNNLVRTTYQALAAVLGGTQSLHTNSYNIF